MPGKKKKGCCYAAQEKNEMSEEKKVISISDIFVKKVTPTMVWLVRILTIMDIFFICAMVWTSYPIRWESHAVILVIGGLFWSPLFYKLLQLLKEIEITW